MQHAIVNLNRTVAPASSTGTRSGLVVLPSGVAAMAMEPITTSEENTDPNGVLVIGRFIGAAGGRRGGARDQAERLGGAPVGSRLDSASPPLW